MIKERGNALLEKNITKTHRGEDSSESNQGKEKLIESCKRKGLFSARKNIKKTHRGDNSSENEIKSCDQETVESVIKEKRPYTSKKTTANPYRRKEGTFSTNPHNVTQTRSKGCAKLGDTVVESSTDVDKVSYREEGTRWRSRRGTTRGEYQQLEGGLSKQELAAKMIAEQRKKRYSMRQNLLDSKASRERDRIRK